jgi:hypothetical protein
MRSLSLYKKPWYRRLLFLGKGVFENGIAVSFYTWIIVLFCEAQSYTVQSGLNKYSEEI